MYQAVGRLAIQSELDFKLLSRVGEFRAVATQAASKEAHLNSPQAGALLDDASRATLQPTNARVQIVVTDGLSAEAVHAGAPPLLQVLFDALRARQVSCSQPLVARYGRVKLAEAIAEATGAELVVMLVGERPGGDAQAARSLSVYLVYHRHQPPGYEYTVISNIHGGGLPPLEAGAVVAERVFQILHFRAAGNRLEAILAGDRDSQKAP
jgi:ethanolamine ammonia-lyase small subunit